MPRITLEDGRWVDLRLPSTRAFLLLLDSPDTDDDDVKGIVTRIRDLRDAFMGSCTGTSWGGPIDDLQPVELSGLVGPWLRATEDDAFPPEQGTDSVTTLPAPDSAATVAA